MPICEWWENLDVSMTNERRWRWNSIGRWRFKRWAHCRRKTQSFVIREHWVKINGRWFKQIK